MEELQRAALVLASISSLCKYEQQQRNDLILFARRLRRLDDVRLNLYDANQNHIFYIAHYDHFVIINRTTALGLETTREHLSGKVSGQNQGLVVCIHTSPEGPDQGLFKCRSNQTVSV